jgi:hypothetical protein
VKKNTSKPVQPVRQRAPSALTGKMMQVHILAKSIWSGQRNVRCVRVQVAKRTGEITSLTVCTYNAMTDKWDGVRIKLHSVSEWTGGGRGIVWFKKIVPVETWLTGNAVPEPKKPHSARAALRMKQLGRAL